MRLVEIMVNDHKHLNKLLDDCENSIDLDDIKRLFSSFVWNLDKHFFVEEKVVFNFSEDIFDLVKQHKDILWTCNNIKKELEKGIRPSLNSLKQTINEHIAFESKNFYPKLESALSESQKELIESRASEIINNE